MISPSFPELHRLQRAAVSAVNAASLGGGSLELCTGVDTAKHEASQLLCEMLAATTVATRAGVTAQVCALTGPAIVALRALLTELDAEIARAAERRAVA